MDGTFENRSDNPIVATGLGNIVLSAAPQDSDDLDVTPWLKSRKTRKFMGKQDKLAVIAAGQALSDAAVDKTCLPRRTGIYLCVGYIPFERADLEPLMQHSTVNGQFSMAQFSTEGMEQVSPLLTFRCLPNMPIFHISMNFGIQGPYFITYPGTGQFYLALERAVNDLQQGIVDLALVGSVADQNNFLVRNHFQRRSSSRKNSVEDKGNLSDAAGFLCLERESCALKRGAMPKLRLVSSAIEYSAPDFLNEFQRHSERLTVSEKCILSDQSEGLGPTTLPVSLCRLSELGITDDIIHEVSTIDGFHATSRWSGHAAPIARNENRMLETL